MMPLVHVTQHLLSGSAQLSSAQLSSARLSMAQEVLCSAAWASPPPQPHLGGLQTRLIITSTHRMQSSTCISIMDNPMLFDHALPAFQPVPLYNLLLFLRLPWVTHPHGQLHDLDP